MPERMIAELCSATLKGVKCASLFNCAYETKGKLVNEVINMNHKLAQKGIHMMILSYPSEGRALIYVFRPSLLQKQLEEEKTRSLMEQLGYCDHRIGCCLNVLQKKLQGYQEFPHEIGCFLGYPTEDVIGFMNHEKCVYYGTWKVYKNVEKAKKLFTLYDKCTRKCLDQMDAGYPLEEIAEPIDTTIGGRI